MNNQNKKGFTITELVLLIAVLIILVSVFTPYHSGGTRRDADRVKAISHLTQVKLALMHFKADHGIYPGQLVVDKALFPGAKADTANDCYRQLIQGLSDVKSEVIFFAPSRISKQTDDETGYKSNNYSPACSKGEVGFLYVDSQEAKEKAPIAAAPLYNTKGKFDYEAYNGKAVVLRRDGSINSYEIDENTGKVIADINEDGKKINIFSPTNPAFTKPPVFKYPEPK